MQPKLKAITIAHLLLSVLVSAVFTAGTATLQYLSGSNLSVSGLLAVAGVAFGGALGTGVLSLEKSPQVQQAVTGLESLLSSHLNALSGLLRDHSAIIQQATHDLSNVLAQAQAQSAQPPPVNANATMGSSLIGVPQVSFPPAQPNPTTFYLPNTNAPVPLPGLSSAPLNRHFDSQIMPTPPRG